MLSLILFRHGKSDWDVPYGTDHDRPLASRGRAAADCMGQALSRAGQTPELAVSSTAVRARDTLQIAARAGDWQCPLRFERALYESSPRAVLSWLRDLEEDPESLLLTGHEPTWSALAGNLVGEARIRVPTAAMLKIDFEVDRWNQVDFGLGQLRWLIPPKLICKNKG